MAKFFGSDDFPSNNGIAPDEPDERGYFSESQTRPRKAATAGTIADPADMAAPAHYHGHRDRLRERFRDQGEAALADYELLELLLFRLIPRRDTKPIAKALIDRFGSLAGVLGAPIHLLQEVKGVGEAESEEH